MPKIQIDYSNTVFYRIYCKDPLVNDVYVSHTTNFVQRKHSHKQAVASHSKQYSCKLYNVIRANKGWNNWNMEIIAFHKCDDLIEAKKYEQQYFEHYKATLNSVEPSLKNKSIHNNYIIENNEPMMTSKQVPNNIKNFKCERCLYKCSKESDWVKHIATRKHLTRTSLNALEQSGEKIAIYGANLQSPATNGEKIATASFVCNCGKQYTARNSLWYHKKTCYISLDDTSSTNLDDITDVGSYLISHQAKVIEQTSTILSSDTKDKDDEFKELILLLLKENKDIQKTFLEILPHLNGNITNNSNNTTTNNNQFNINMFLNEHCKHAMNLTDFIHSLPITNETYDHTIENGLTKTITNMITNGLNKMDVLERPIHCTDPARKTMYIKDNNVWEKDNELKLLLHGIKILSMKQRTSINKWQDVNIGWDKDDNLQTKLTTLVFNSMTNIETDEKEVNKIIRAISKSTYLTTQIKNEYL